MEKCRGDYESAMHYDCRCCEEYNHCKYRKDISISPIIISIIIITAIILLLL